jgi:hypothetical protein
MRKRLVWVAPLIAEAKIRDGLRRFKLHGLANVNGEALLTAFEPENPLARWNLTICSAEGVSVLGATRAAHRSRPLLGGLMLVLLWLGTWITTLAGPLTAAQDAAGRVPILVYHTVDETGNTYSITPRQLKLQCRWLVEHGYTAITLSQFWRAARGLADLPPNPVILTDDDGDPSARTFARILDRYGLVGNYFVNNRGGDGHRCGLWPRRNRGRRRCDRLVHDSADNDLRRRRSGDVRHEGLRRVIRRMDWPRPYQLGGSVENENGRSRPSSMSSRMVMPPPRVTWCSSL